MSAHDPKYNAWFYLGLAALLALMLATAPGYQRRQQLDQVPTPGPTPVLAPDPECVTAIATELFNPMGADVWAVASWSSAVTDRGSR